MVASRPVLVLVSRARALSELTQDVPKPPVHLFEHGDMLIGRPTRQTAQSGYGFVDPVITCRQYFPGGATPRDPPD